MITINLKEVSTLKNKNFNNNIKVIPTKTLNQLEQLVLPISNRDTAFKNICDFLGYLNNQYNKTNKTILPISKDVFVKYFNNKKYTEYKTLFESLNIITRVPYEDGTFYSKDNGLSLQYRIHNSYLKADDFSLLIFKKSRNNTTKVNIQCDINNIMLDTVVKEDLDYKRVFEEEIKYHLENNTTNFSLFIRLTRALSLNRERYIKYGKTVNRIFHSFSNLSKVTRKCFNTKFYEVDLVNAQPMLLALYLNKNNISYESEYREVCEEGKFYELFEGLLNTRDEIKVECYSSLFFDFKENSNINKRFKELFPLLWKVLKDIKKSKVTLASILQNLEADIFNNIEVKSSSKYYTLFDAVYFNSVNDKEYIEKQILSYGNKHNLKFKIK